jgi:hypothetical protein
MMSNTGINIHPGWGQLAYPLPLPGKLPSGWELIETRDDGGRWLNRKDLRIVIASFAIEADGRLWLHTSLSRRGRIPSYEDLVYLKRHWIGDDRKAVMVLPKRSEHVNIHPYVLHLFSCMDEDPLPDFTHGRGSL